MEQIIMIWLMILSLVYFSNIEFKQILSNRYKNSVTEVDIHLSSAEILMDSIIKDNVFYGIFYIFRYQILIILYIIIYDIQYYLMFNSLNISMIVISSVSIGLLLLNIFLPLLKIYFPAILDSLNLKMTLRDWFYKKYNYISREILIDTFSLSKEFISNVKSELKKLSIADYDKYVDILNGLDIEHIKPLSENEFIDYLVLFESNDILFYHNEKISSLYLNENAEIYNIGIYPDKIWFSLEAESSIIKKNNERYLDSLFLFTILYLIS